MNLPIASPLPDVASSEPSTIAAPLQWVGMDGIAVPVRLCDTAETERLPAQAALHVDLPAAQVKGIHMSRLYRLLDEYAEQALSPSQLSQLLRAMVHSHADCASTAARISLRMALLRRSPALRSEGLAGWKAYPLRIDAVLRGGNVRIEVGVEVLYSSTCPCSAALARQLLSAAFLQQHAEQPALPRDAVAAWLLQHGSHATPHSQRSIATLRVAVSPHAVRFDLDALIALAEQALSTPVQAAVRRADEQAFARLNGANLMYVEDAARRLQQALGARYRGVRVQVRHLESLHPHDAVAEAGAAEGDVGDLDPFAAGEGAR
jgi:GTP cyclohydrolase IB